MPFGIPSEDFDGGFGLPSAPIDDVQAAQRWASLPDIDNETVKIWIDALLESRHKTLVETLTVEEIKAEIEETEGSIRNFRSWGDKHTIVDCEEYLEVLTELLNKITV